MSIDACPKCGEPLRSVRVARAIAALTEFFDGIDRKEFFVEDFDPRLWDRLRKALNLEATP